MHIHVLATVRKGKLMSTDDKRHRCDELVRGNNDNGIMVIRI